uniref:Uncharacterized protein n=1 Tax=Romanomermis culicivorax TaxID=13658 RepID=A0A915JJT2_ROMCU
MAQSTSTSDRSLSSSLDNYGYFLARSTDQTFCIALMMDDEESMTLLFALYFPLIAAIALKDTIERNSSIIPNEQNYMQENQWSTEEEFLMAVFQTIETALSIGQKLQLIKISNQLSN